MDMWINRSNYKKVAYSNNLNNNNNRREVNSDTPSLSFFAEIFIF